jgi:lipoprotein-releasing system permease protein
MIAIGGVIVGVSALIVIIGVMNGLQKDLREKILIGSPDVRILTYGEDMKMTDWQTALRTVRSVPGVVAAAPFVLAQAGITAGHDYGEGVFVMGIEPARPGLREVTNVRQFAIGGDFEFRASDGTRRGVVLGSRLASRLQVRAGVDTITLVPITGVKFNPSIGAIVPPPPRRTSCCWTYACRSRPAWRRASPSRTRSRRPTSSC